MINLVKYVLIEYRTLFMKMKMALDAPIMPSIKLNFSLLVDVETLLGLDVVMPLV
jgi:hypothetical protein